MFQINSGQVGNSIFHQVRSGYDAYYDHTQTNMEPQAPHTFRSYTSKHITFIQNRYEDVNIWEALNGRPVPPGLPFGSFVFKSPTTVTEWKNRAYCMLFGGYAIVHYFTYTDILYNSFGKSTERVRALYNRKLYNLFVHLFVGGLVWINYVGWVKEKSKAYVYHQMSNGERIKLSILLGAVAGALERKDSAPWHGQYPRMSMIFHRAMSYFLIYGIIYTVAIHIFLPRSLTITHTDKKSPFYNVVPWWWEKDSLPYHHFDGTQNYRTLNYRQQMQLPKIDAPQIVDEYSASYMKSTRPSSF